MNLPDKEQYLISYHANRLRREAARAQRREDRCLAFANQQKADKHASIAIFLLICFCTGLFGSLVWMVAKGVMNR